MIEFVLYFILTALTGLVTWLIWHARASYGSLEKLGHIFPTIKPAFILGSMPNMHKVIVHEEDLKNHKKYGPIFGMYEGNMPEIFISDPELVRKIFIKDHEYFNEKRKFESVDPMISESMDALHADKWKVVRTFFSPTFTTGKIKYMTSTMVEAIKEAVMDLKAKTKVSSEIYVKDIYNALTIDIISRCAFGMKLNGIRDPSNEFVKNVMALVPNSQEMNIMLPIAMTYQFLFSFMDIFPKKVLHYFRRIIVDVTTKRRESNVKINDFVDSLNEMLKLLPTEEYRKLKISEDTVYCQALIFIFAGFDTSATTLSMLTYRLATNPEKQQKLIEEIDAFLARHNGEINYENIRELEYLEACVKETLRMCPPLIRVERECQKDWSDPESGLEVKKGMLIQVSAWRMHYDPKYYPEPEEYQPERFLPKNKDKLNQYAYLPFGQGPHNCIGMRFALEEIKLAMAHILKDFSISPCAETKIKFKTGRSFLVQYDPIKVKFNQRN